MTDALLLTTVTTTLAAGFFGSPHCLGMCGGIVGALSFALASETPQRRLALQTVYHLGRLVSYSLLGLVAGLLGAGLFAPLAGSHWPYVATALMTVAFGLYLTGWWRGLDRLERLGSRLWQAMTPLRQRFMPINTVPRALIAGMLWGFLPCGLVYSALALALTGAGATTSPLTAGAAMLAFGLGTLPMMLLAGSTAGELKQKLQQHGWRTANGLLIVAFGVWTLLQTFMHDHDGGHAHHHAQQAQAATHAVPAAAVTSAAPVVETAPEVHQHAMAMPGMEGHDMDSMMMDGMAHAHKEDEHAHHHD